MTYRVRPSWDDYYLNIAWVVSRQSNCLHRSVGALLVLDRRIISTGYDGTASGVRDCSESGCANCASAILPHQFYQRCLCLHAEQNAIGLAARHGVMTNYATLYTTLRPCLECFKLAIQAGIREIVYDRSLDFNEQLEETYHSLITETSVIVRQHPYSSLL